MYLALLIVPVILLYIFRKKKPSRKKEELVVRHPDISSLGIMLTVMCTLIMTIFTITDNPWLIFYVVFFSGYFLGIYFLWISGHWEVIVRQQHDIIFVRLFFPTMRFTLDDIKSIEFQSRNNYYGSSERMVIKTNKKKRIVLDGKCSNYKQFCELLKERLK